MSSADIARRRAQQIRKNRAKQGASPVRLVVCGVIFVLLVAVKLLFPDTLEELAGSVKRLIGHDADFQEAFAAVGRAVSGEQAVSDSLQEAYTAVFNPSQEQEPAPNSEPAPQTDPTDSPDTSSFPDGAGALLADPRSLRYSGLSLPEADKVVMREVLISPGEDPIAQPAGDAAPVGDVSPDVTDDSNTAATAEAFQLYSMAALPENASLEQRNLGFPHCTPVAGKLSSAFGWREHPVEGGNKFHYGVDLAANAGSDILAFADGDVYASGESSSLGYYLILRHQNGYSTLYAHCSKITATSGHVAMGEKIAEVGDTGLATGPHLHFELHDGDLNLNPIYYVDVG